MSSRTCAVDTTKTGISSGSSMNYLFKAQPGRVDNGNVFLLGAHKPLSPHVGFQIEQSNEGGYRIVRICNANTTSPNSKKEHETTPNPTQGKKRSQNEMHNGVNTIVGNNCAT